MILPIASVVESIQKIAEQNPIDVLITSGRSFSLLKRPQNKIQRVFDINVKGTYSPVQAVLPSMKKHGSGSIIVIASNQSLIAKRNSLPQPEQSGPAH